MLAVLDTVYACRTGGAEYEGTPSFTVTGGTVNVYWSNNSSAKPADASEMILDSNSPVAADIYPVTIQATWILFEAASGSPEVYTCGLI